jgi:hypothetical protein
VRAAWIGWIAFCLLAALKTVLAVQDSPVNRSYSYGAKLWWMHEDLYDGAGTGFIYLPQSAVLQLPFIFLPGPAHDYSWRIVTIGLFALGIWKLSRLGNRRAAVAIFPLVTLLTLPKTWTVAVNGQATPAMAGLMMLAMASIARRNWWQAVAALLGALAFKPLAIVLVLLAGALHSPLRWRLLVGLAVFLAVPFLTQDPQYVIAQYSGFIENLHDSAQVGHTREWPQLFSLLQVLGIELSEHARLVTQVAAGLVTLMAAWQVRQKFHAREAALLVYSLATTYLLLFNPRTENNTYSMLVPAIAVFAACDLLVTRLTKRAVLHLSLIGALTGGFEICKAFSPGAPFVWPCVLGALAFAGDLALTIARGPATANANSTSEGLADRDVQDSTHVPTRWRAA